MFYNCKLAGKETVNVTFEFEVDSSFLPVFVHILKQCDDPFKSSIYTNKAVWAVILILIALCVYKGMKGEASNIKNSVKKYQSIKQ